MDVNVINELQNGLSAAYINGSVAANLAYKPAFVSNNPEEGEKVISSVEDELLRCDEFQISVTWDNLLWWKPEMPGKKIIADVCNRSRK